jgi:cytoskeletal protein RodZ
VVSLLSASIDLPKLFGIHRATFELRHGTDSGRRFAMKQFILRFLLAAALVMCITALSADINAQAPSSQEPAATAPPQQQSPSSSPSDQQTPSEQEPTARPQQEPHEPAANSSQNEPQMPAAGSDVQTQDAKAFTGRIVRENGKVVLKDPVTKTSYQIDDVSKVKAYMGKEVKVTGKLDMNSNTIHIESIVPIS